MPTAEELLQSMLDDVPEHTHRVVDSDTYFIIDPITRQMSNTALSKNVLMQYDHDSERFTFELPRYIEGHDMMLCNSVKVHYINIGESNMEYADVCDLDDLRVDPNSSDNVICSWLISRNATQLAGMLSFLVQYMCTDNGEPVYEWHTDIYSDIEIKPGRSNSEASIIQYTDILEQWRLKLFGDKDSLISDIQSAAAIQQDNIAAKGAETMASIPEEYTEVANMADEALRRKADAVELTEYGEFITLDDSSDNNFIGLNLYGKTTRFSTTGKNLLNNTLVSNNTQGISFVVRPDKTVIANGTATGDIFLTLEAGFANPGVEMIVTGCPKGGSTTSYLIYMTDGYTYIHDTGDSKTFTMTDDQVFTVRIAVYRGTVLDNVVFKPMIRLSSISDDTYEPYSNEAQSPSPTNSQPLSSVVNPLVKIYSKNLCPMSAFNSMTSNGQSNTYDSIAHRVTVNANTNLDNFTGRYCRPIGSGFVVGKIGTISFDIRGTNGRKVSCGWDTNRTEITLTKEFARYSSTKLIHRADEVVSFYTVATEIGGLASGEYFEFDNVQIEYGDATEYEEYKTPQSTAFNYTLYGIPVSQNGNYTDSNGQQWVCDEVDLERGKLIQRVRKVTIDGTQSYGLNNYNEVHLGYHAFEYYPGDINGDQVSIPVLSNKLLTETWGNYSPNDDRIYCTAARIVIGFKDQINIATVEDFTAYVQSNPIEVIYERNTPVETDLTAAEIQAFKNLMTYSTNTVVYNEQGSPMSVKYVADLERYIYKNVSYKRAKFNLSLNEASWVESSDGRYYTQVLNINARPNSEINLHPTAAQQVSLILDGIAMFVANEDGVCTAYCIGSTPGKNITIQATETVVVYE